MNSASPSNFKDVDLAIVGGGLSGALIAWRLATARPELDIALVERGPNLGGNHTWSFHETDVPAETYEWIKPLIAHRWASQEVRFPAYQRPISTPYCSITSEKLHEIVAAELGDRIHFSEEVKDLGTNGVTLGSGERISAKAVIDARGQRGFEHLILGYQKFVGAEYRFTKPHGLTAPIIMDATVPQLDGYRFVYVLPFSEDTALVEDTYYADGAALDTDATTKRLEDYCTEHGWEIAETLRLEQGVLPVALGGDIKAHLDQGIPGVASVGLRAGLFHPLTGYSFPDAARMAEDIAALPDLSGDVLAPFCRQNAEEIWRSRGFYRMLSRFLFDAATPQNRYLVMQRFYRLNRGLVERFYGGRSEMKDKLRVLSGKPPPVNILKAMACIDEKQWSNRFRSATA